MTCFFSVAIGGCHLSLFDKFLYNVLHRFVFFSHLSPCAESIVFDLVSTIIDSTLAIIENRILFRIEYTPEVEYIIENKYSNAYLLPVIHCWVTLWCLNIILFVDTVCTLNMKWGVFTETSCNCRPRPSANWHLKCVLNAGREYYAYDIHFGRGDVDLVKPRKTKNKLTA